MHMGTPLAAALVLSAVSVYAQALTPATQDDDSRILGLIPNYQTVSDPNAPVTSMTRMQKWKLFARESVDPFNLAGAVLGAGLSQAGNSFPKYGGGSGAFGERFGASVADMTTQSFFSCALLAPLLHQDPRYFRKGPGSGIPSRILYSMSRVFITRQDSGKAAVNISGLLGMAMGIALSNAYYPDSNVSGAVVASRFRTSITGAVLSNLLPEFWPDVQKHLFHRKQHDTQP